MTTDSSTTIQQEMDAVVVATILGREVTRREMREAFDKVANQANWKMPINATIPIDNDFDLLLVREAVIFFTGSVPEITVATYVRPRCKYRVRAAGYYQTIGA
jgi:hypothetical protein